jgi:hypothetical protein
VSTGAPRGHQQHICTALLLKSPISSLKLCWQDTELALRGRSIVRRDIVEILLEFHADPNIPHKRCSPLGHHLLLSWRQRGALSTNYAPSIGLQRFHASLDSSVQWRARVRKSPHQCRGIQERSCKHGEV